MQARESDWERLEGVIEWANLNTNAFARAIGLSRAENLYQIKRGNNGISRKLADMITRRYPEIDISWMLTGEGDMFARGEERGARIPFYDIDLERDVLSYLALEPSSYISIPQSVEADVAMLYRGRAMGAVTPINSVVALKRVERDMIIGGGEYLITTARYSLLRIVRVMTSGDRAKLRLVAGERDLYDDVIIRCDEIKSCYRVAAKIIIPS